MRRLLPSCSIIEHVASFELGKTKLPMPVLVISGEKAGGKGLGEQLKLVAKDVTPIVLKDTGQWVIDERPAEVLEALQKFL